MQKSIKPIKPIQSIKPTQSIQPIPISMPISMPISIPISSKEICNGIVKKTGLKCTTTAKYNGYCGFHKL